MRLGMRRDHTVVAGCWLQEAQSRRAVCFERHGWNQHELQVHLFTWNGALIDAGK